MEKKDIFADFINGAVFGGRKAVLPEELEPAPEARNELHYVMPARCMEYDALEYAGHLRKRRQQHRKKKNLKESAHVIAMMKRAGDKEAMKAYCRENEERFQEMEEETYDVIGVMINHRKLERYKEKIRIEGGKVNMCKAMDEMTEDSRRDGRRDGIRIGERNGERKFAALAGRPMADSGTKDLEKAVNNEAFRRKLYREYGMK